MTTLNPLRVLLLSLGVFVLYSINFLRLDISSPFHGNSFELISGALMQGIALGFLVSASRWSGQVLTTTVFVVHFTASMLLVYLDSWNILVELTGNMTHSELYDLVTNGFIQSLLTAPLATLAFGKYRKGREPADKNIRAMLPAKQWALKFPALVAAYPALHVLAGALVFIPLAGPALEHYTGGLDLSDVNLALQLVGGILWAMISLPIIRMAGGGFLQIALSVILPFALLPASLVVAGVLPLPSAIRWAYAAEILVSMGLFGLLAALWVHRPHRSLLDTFRP
ncbi:MAG: hypothetical protein OEV94_11095 [Deltaproteobacteria bacterium]|nr:hypothetical protein [Deltaproteobacteria bacterium]